MTLCHLTWYLLYCPSSGGQELLVPTEEGPGPRTAPRHRERLAALWHSEVTVGSLRFILSTQVPWTASATDRILASHACCSADPTLPKSPTEGLWLSDQLQQLRPWGFPGHQLELPPGHLSPATLTRNPVLSCSLPGALESPQGPPS